MNNKAIRLKMIYDEFTACEDYNSKLDMDKVQKIMSKYDNENLDVNVLKTVLVITNGFKDHPAIADVRKSILAKYEKKKDKDS